MTFIFKKLPTGYTNIDSFIGHLGCSQTFASINATTGPGSMEFAKFLLGGALQLP